MAFKILAGTNRKSAGFGVKFVMAGEGSLYLPQGESIWRVL
jgi:hypothetical protein